MKNYITFLLFFFVSLAHSVNFDIYKTSILVEDTKTNDPLKLTQAFAQIIANNTGEEMTTILNNSIFATANIKRGIKRSYFEKIENKYLSDQSPHNYWFYLVMQESYVKNIIKQSGFSVLPHNREKIMLWVVAKLETLEDEELQDKPLSYAYDNDLIMYWINHWSIALGLNTVYPEIDELDENAVTLPSIQNLSFEADLQSQKRYNINQILQIFIKQNTQQLKIRSGYKTVGSEILINQFNENTLDIGVVLYSVLSNAAQNYANKYRINPDQLQQHTVQIIINSLINYDDVNSTTKYLTNLSVVDNYSIVSASVGQIIVTAELSISNESFKKIIARDKTLAISNNTSINQLVLNYINAQ